jgi:hypothetical protein
MPYRSGPLGGALASPRLDRSCLPLPHISRERAISYPHSQPHDALHGQAAANTRTAGKQGQVQPARRHSYRKLPHAVRV